MCNCEVDYNVEENRFRHEYSAALVTLGDEQIVYFVYCKLKAWLIWYPKAKLKYFCVCLKFMIRRLRDLDLLETFKSIFKQTRFELEQRLILIESLEE